MNKAPPPITERPERPENALFRAAAVIVAAGKGLRAGQPVPKQFADWRGKPVLRHSAESLIRAGCSPIVVAIPEGADAIASQVLRGLDGVQLVTGGNTRQLSVQAALEALVPAKPDYVLIHDAARPELPADMVQRLCTALADYPGAIPVLSVVDSLALDEGGLMAGSAAREQLRRVQTPQAFRFQDILGAQRNWQGEANAGDDAQVARAAGLQVALVEGDEMLRKLTFGADFDAVIAGKPASTLPAIRVGTGYDVHRFATGEDLWLCGVRVDHTKGLTGHSDADVAMHALVDALLGAIGAGDIGSHFPPSDPQWQGASSSQFLEHAVLLVRQAGYCIGNVDLTIICEAPRIGPHRDAMQARLAQIMGVDITCVSVKATTTERLGFTGRGEGIAAQAAASVLRMER